MLKRQHSVRLGEDMPQRISSCYARVPRKRRVFFWAACLGLLLVVLNLASGQLSGTAAYALPVPAAFQLKGLPSTPNTANSSTGTHSLTRTPQLSAPGSAKPGTPQTITHSTKMSMRAGAVGLRWTRSILLLFSTFPISMRLLG